MPYKMRKGKGGYTVSSPHGVKGKGMTLRNAKSQIRLLNAVEHGYDPKRKRKKKKKGPKGNPWWPWFNK